MSTIKWSSGQGELCGEFYRAGWGIQSKKPKDSRNQKVKGQSGLDDGYILVMKRCVLKRHT